MGESRAARLDAGCRGAADDARTAPADGFLSDSVTPGSSDPLCTLAASFTSGRARVSPLRVPVAGARHRPCFYRRCQPRVAPARHSAQPPRLSATRREQLALSAARCASHPHPEPPVAQLDGLPRCAPATVRAQSGKDDRAKRRPLRFRPRTAHRLVAGRSVRRRAGDVSAQPRYAPQRVLRSSGCTVIQRAHQNWPTATKSRSS